MQVKTIAVLMLITLNVGYSAVPTNKREKNNHGENAMEKGTGVPEVQKVYSYLVKHAGTETRVTGDQPIYYENILDQVDVPEEAYVFTTTKLPEHLQLMPSIANGHVGTSVYNAEVYMNGLYNGAHGQSHRAIIPSACAINITRIVPETQATRSYTLNAREGAYKEAWNGADFTIHQRIYAHRQITSLLVVQIDLARPNPKSSMKLQLELNTHDKSPDLTIKEVVGHSLKTARYKIGTTIIPETETSGTQQVHYVHDQVPEELVSPAGVIRTRWVFLTAIGTSKKEVFDAYRKGSELAKAGDELYKQHVDLWEKTWQKSRIDIDGNLTIARAVYGSWYYILSSLPMEQHPTSPYVGLSPSGLPRGAQHKDYMGHVFWDQETWMYPPILLFHPHLGKILVNTRSRTHQAALENAKKYGNQGSQYPWESAFTGVEVCPEDIYAINELHITGDIAFAIQQYLHATNDASILTEGPFETIVDNIATFWASRSHFNKTNDRYEIHGVMPPDEYHKNISNSVYTNIVAKISLLLPDYVAKLTGQKADPRFKIVAEKMYIPFDAKLNYHPEFDGYTPGTKVKQADVILLGFPLMHNMSDKVRRNDLSMYEKVTDPRGPAMTWSMFSANWLELKEFGKANELFQRNFDYIKNDFQVWTETPVGDVTYDAMNFITGMGGFLQNIIFGYGGVRIRPDCLDIDPVLPPETTGMHFVGVGYLGSSLTVDVDEDNMTLVVTAHEATSVALNLYEYSTQKVHALDLLKPVTLKRSKVAVKAAK